MYESFFSYNLTRPYPYRWFTWVVVVGGLAATALFTVINLAANGYEPSVLYTSDLNGTEHPQKPAWFQKKPWVLTNKVSSTCQSQELTVGNYYYTNNNQFPYLLIRLEEQGQQGARNSFAYRNSYIQSCGLTKMNLTVTPEGVDAKTILNCSIYGDTSLVTALLSVSNTISIIGTFSSTGGDFDLPQLESLDHYKQPGLTWGVRMTNLYNQYLHEYRGQYDVNLHYWINYLTGNICPANSTFCAMNWLQRGNATDQTHLVSQDTSEIQSGGDPGMPIDAWTSTFGWDMLSPGNTPANQVSLNFTKTDLALDGFAKALYSTFLADLGQNKSNPFASPEMVVEFAKKTVEVFGGIGIEGGIEGPEDSQAWYDQYSDNTMLQYSILDPTNPPNATIDQLYAKAHIGLPEVGPITISTRYLCQVPVLKSTGSLIISIIVADLVFLQVFWSALNLITTFILGRQDPEAMHCKGAVQEGIPLSNSDDEEKVTKLTTSSPTTYTLLPRVDARDSLSISPPEPPAVDSETVQHRSKTY